MPEVFAPKLGEGLEQAMNARRQTLYHFFEKAAQSREVGKEGMDIQALNNELTKSEQGTVMIQNGSEESASFFMARFHPDLKYAPLAQFEHFPREAQPLEIRVLVGLVSYLKDIFVRRFHVNPAQIVPSDRIIIGFAKQNLKRIVEPLGGYHSQL